MERSGSMETRFLMNSKDLSESIGIKMYHMISAPDTTTQQHNSTTAQQNLTSHCRNNNNNNNNNNNDVIYLILNYNVGLC